MSILFMFVLAFTDFNNVVHLKIHNELYSREQCESLVALSLAQFEDLTQVAAQCIGIPQ